MNIAILIPCYNEELTIGKVINDFRKELPEANIYVYDNNSTDRTSTIALSNDAIVKKEPRQGKGNVVRSMFRDIEADYYIMVDGDDTYPAEYAKKFLEYLVAGEADMVIGDRLSNGTYKNENKRRFHDVGNSLVRSIINIIYKSSINDIMTGYRGFSKLFVKSFPALSPGFEIETELTVHSLDKRFLIKELPIIYRDRPSGSVSKLNTFTDGARVIKTIIKLFKDYKPLIFFSAWAFIFFVLGMAVGLPAVFEFFETHYITKVPSAILAASLVILSMLSMSSGLILDTIVTNARKQYELELNIIKKIVVCSSISSS